MNGTSTTQHSDHIASEKRNRIRVSLWAYAYEIMDDPLVPDAVFDTVCKEIKPEKPTDNALMDDFFRTEFSPHTGQWVLRHPDAQKLAAIYQRLTGKPARPVPAYNNDSPPVTKAVSSAGFKTHIEMKFYLASLGFRVVSHHSRIGERMCETVFDTDCAYVTDIETKEQITIFYKDVYGVPH